MLNGVLKKQSLNDTGMATLFKINQITAAMESQDEQDKQKIFLMGAGGNKEESKKMDANINSCSTVCSQDDPSSTNG